MNERERLEELQGYAILDTPPEAQFDSLVAIAAKTCGVPIALVSLIDKDRQWFKAKIGLALAETPREQAFCAHTILGSDPFIVHDASIDPRFEHNVLVQGEPGIRFYAGVPLVTPRGLNLGSLCVIDREPRSLTPEQLSILQLLGAQVVQLLELRRAADIFRRQSALLSQSQRTAHIGGWEIDLRTNTLSWTEETYRLHGVSKEDYVPTLESAIQFYTPASAKIIQRAVAAAMTRRTPYDLELQIVRKDGTLRWIRTLGQRETDGAPVPRLYGVFQDVTEQRQLEQEIVRIAEDEQERIGADLHDSLGQELVGIAYLISGLQSGLRSKAPELAGDAAAIETLINRSVELCRDLASGLAPTGAEAGGLVPALRALALRLEKMHPVHIPLRVRGHVHLQSGSVADHLFRIVQEALTNAIKHGASPRILIAIDSTERRLRITITDNGLWVAPNPAKAGLGLRLMRHRARLIGATVDVEPTPAGGTRVRCELVHHAEALMPNVNRSRE